MKINEKKVYRIAVFFGIVVLVISWMPFFNKYFGCAACSPVGGYTAYLSDLTFDAFEEEVIVEDAETEIVEVAEPDQQQAIDVTSYSVYSPQQLKRLGVIKWGGYKYTWYSQNILPGKGLKIPGRHVSKEGYVVDQDGYICGASQMHEKGTVLDSPFGYKVKIYDWCDIDSIDIYTDF